ncbi:Cytochrome c biogenesis protein CcsA [termite gut metagenome]|uniref:Cytochrome c biogenesis protein CcsA n=1 Tax=termite gut metagenome TaxID=433724 RepID=A0A5J4R5B8_9ZZZZ
MIETKYIKKCAFGALIAALVVLASATAVEKIFGREAALEYVYGSWWFVVLWGILGITAVAYMLRQALYRRQAACLLHGAFVIILVGAFVTFLTADRGYIHLRQGETLATYISEDDDVSELPLPFDVKLVLFDIAYHPGTDEPADFISFLKVDGEMCQVSMNKIHSLHGYRFYQMSYDPDEMGTTLMINHDPWGIGITYTGYALLALAMLGLLWQRIGWRGLLYTALPTTALWYYVSQMNPMTPILRSPMLAAHVSVIMISYGLLVFIAVTATIALCSWRLRERFYRLNSKLLYPALFLLAAGIFIGAVWANISWGRYWGWDAKETWALITMLVYALPLHKGSLALFRNPVGFHRYCLIACLTVAMTFLGVTYLLGGMHSYV